MILPEFQYLAPDTLEEACRLAKEHYEDGKIIAGGTDVIVAMKENHISPRYIIDIKNVDGLDYIDFEPTVGLKIGALTKLRVIEKSPFIQKEYKAVADAAHFVASTQVRARGTMAGNVVNASPSADTAPILLALHAKLRVMGTRGERQIPMEAFYTGYKKTALEPGEIVTEIIIPPMKENQHAAYIKHAVRKAMDLAIVGVAASLQVAGGIVEAADITLGAVAATPIHAREAERALIGKELTEETVSLASEAAMRECSPIGDVRASSAYRKDMVRVFTRRTIKMAMEQ